MELTRCHTQRSSEASALRCAFSANVTISKTLLLLMIFLCVGIGQQMTPAVRAQSINRLDRDRALQMLDSIKNDIKKNYYDPSYHGMDLDARFKTAEEKIKSSTSLGQAFGVIAQAMLDLDDSHTFFLPPARAARVEYGWQMQMIGDKCYVVAIKPGSDAEAKQLKVGDVVHSVDGVAPTREIMWKMNYLYYALRPQAGMRVVVQSPGSSEPRQLDVMAKITQGKRLLDFTGSGSDVDIRNALREAENESRLNPHRLWDGNGDFAIWKMPEFDLTEPQVDELMDKVKKHRALILDLRGNAGGAEVTLLRLLGHFFEADTKIGDIKRRKETKPLVAKKRGNPFTGALVVLVDNNSGSSAEIFARVIQLEKRGKVIGDQSAGAVMRAKHYEHQAGLDTIVPYGASVTDADLMMTDGKSLEHIGVTPDEMLLPTGADLAAKRDPVSSRAAALIGAKLSPEKAGALFPLQWQK